MQRMWTEAENRQLAQLAETHTAKQIADLMGRTAGGVQEHARRNGVRLLKYGQAHYRNTLTKEDIATILRLGSEGKYPSEIAKVVGTHKMNVYDILRYEKRWRETIDL